MDGKKQVGSSSSSFTSELFGSKDSSSSSGIFGSIFAPSSKVVGRESLRSGVPERKQNTLSESCNYKHGTSVDSFNNKETEDQSLSNGDTGSIYQDQRVQQPCHLSSSIYYGGQDICSHPQSTSTPSSTFKKDGGEDDSGSASRGNWWQGSLYY